MSRKYKFHNPESPYFVSFAVEKWIDVFTRPEYCTILLQSFRFCQREKGLVICAWVIMSNHVHLIIRKKTDLQLWEILRDFKKFTSRNMIKAISTNPKEGRKKWLLELFWNDNFNGYRFWREGNHPIELWSDFVIQQKLEYIHMNPVKRGIVQYPDEFLHSSARDYQGRKGLLHLELI
ncbi:MAG TPA: transposase [Flavobacteriales bacterium]|jgi:REP element-mobilizing transposase RayT|nr:transposase [Flavobacteriales bacterium]